MKNLWLLFILTLILVACADNGSGEPAQVVETYLQAKVESDADVLRRLLCSAMEANLERETRTFASVTDVHIEGMACTRAGQSDMVQCQGKIIALYGAEQTEFPLVSYRVVQEDGEWKWCGETS